MDPATSSAKSSAHCWYDPAVYAAAKAGDLSKVQAFIQAGGWVDMPDAKGNSMFYYACKKGQIEVVRYLLCQGTHHYGNLKGKTGLEKAPENVKQLVQEIEASRKEVTALVYNQSLQIALKASSFESYEEGMRFISSIVNEKVRQNALEEFAMHSGFDSPYAVLLLKYVAGKEQDIVAKTLVKTFLSCGDIEAATRVLGNLDQSCSIKMLLTSMVKCAEELLSEMEEATNKDDFKASIERGINLKNIYDKLPKEVIVKMVEGMVAAGSFKGALEFTNGLTKPYRGFARNALCYSGLEGLADEAMKAAEKKFAASAEDTSPLLKTLLEEAKEKKDFSKVIKSVNTEVQGKNSNILLEVCFEMGKAGLYQEAYDFLNKHRNDVCELLNFFIDQFIDKILECSEEKQEEWIKRFSGLKKTGLKLT